MRLINYILVSEAVSSKESHTKKLFLDAKKIKKDYQIAILRKIWDEYNRLFFGKKLERGPIRFQKDTGKKFRQRGSYSGFSNTLSFSFRILYPDVTYEKFREIFLHEMCHQATRQISNERAAHGEAWKSWMIKVGLNPSRIDYEVDMYLTSKEREERDKEEAERKKKIDIIIKQKEDTKRKEGFSNRIWPERMKPAKAIGLDGKTILGMIVCPHDKKGIKWAFVSNADVWSNKFHIISHMEFYKASSLEDKDIRNDRALQTKVEKVQKHYEVKATVKAFKKGAKWW